MYFKNEKKILKQRVEKANTESVKKNRNFIKILGLLEIIKENYVLLKNNIKNVSGSSRHLLTSKFKSSTVI